jgi:hypothetical protein
VRKLIQPYTSKDLDYVYFAQDLLVQYQREHGALRGLYADPRGVLYEPHTGRAIPLGTMAVEVYQFPAWRYDKILYVEKKGLWPILQDAQLAERYDMAVVAGEGYATEAIRVLFQHANTEQQYQLFVLHDADPDGYNIARTLREETDRMPGYAVEIHDLGLTIEEVLALGLDTEEFTRQKALPSGLVLSEASQVAFAGRRLGPKSWIAQRVELNAFSAPALVTYLEQQLQRAGVRGKVIPSAKALPALAIRAYRQELDTLARWALAALLQTDAIVDQVIEHFADRMPLDDARTWIEEALTEIPTLAWDRALARKIASLAWPLWDEIEADVRTVLRRVVQEEFTEESEESENDDAVC